METDGLLDAALLADTIEVYINEILELKQEIEALTAALEGAVDLLWKYGAAGILGGGSG